MGKRIKELEGQLAQANQWVLDAQKKADHWFQAATYWSQGAEVLAAEVNTQAATLDAIKVRCELASDGELLLASDVLDIVTPKEVSEEASPVAVSGE